MVLTADQKRVKALLTETITLLCKNGLHFQSKFCIEGLIGITLDEGDVFLVSINETFHTLIDDAGSNEQVSSHPVVEEPLNSNRIDKKRRRSPSTRDPLMQVESSAPGLSNSLCEDAVQEQIILSRSAVSCSEQPSDGKSEIVVGGFSQFTNVHNLHDVSFKEEVVEEGNSDSLQTLTIREASRKTNEFNDQIKAQTVQEAVEPVRKRPLTDGKDSDKESQNKHGRSQCSSPGISCDKRSRSDGEVIHIKEETTSDEDLAHSENLSYDYLSLYGVDVSQGCSAPTVTAVPLADKSSRLSLPGCSTWSRQNSLEQSTSNNLQMELVPGSGVCISCETHHLFEQDKLMKGSKLVRLLVHELFPDERVLAMSSCLGRRQGTTRAGLDQRKVDAIKVFVQNRLPQMSHSKIVLTINECCRDARTKLRRVIFRQWKAGGKSDERLKGCKS